jgi:hypothetical protein
LHRCTVATISLREGGVVAETTRCADYSARRAVGASDFIHGKIFYSEENRDLRRSRHKTA